MVLPERASPSTELLRSTFLTLLSVLQTFIVIAKLSGRKTKLFLDFFFKTIAGATYSEQVIYLK